MSKTLCLFDHRIAPNKSVLQVLSSFNVQLACKTLRAAQDAFASRIRAILKGQKAKASCNKTTRFHQHSHFCKTVRRFLLQRRDIYMCTHARPCGANNSKKCAKRLAYAEGLDQ